MNLIETGKKTKVSELLKQLDGTYQEEDKQKKEATIRRLADLYSIDTRYKRLDTLELEVQQEEERRQNLKVQEHFNNI